MIVDTGLRRNAKAASIFVLIVCASLVIVTQLASGCFGAEFGDDEASHYISGLMIHDYLQSGFHVSPINYLKWYHSHYPLVAIGHWGPAFYIAEALWMSVFSPSRISVLLLSGVMVSVTATLIYYYGTVYVRLGHLASVFAAVGFVICPIVQEGSSTVMLDVPITLCVFLAMMAYVRYVETERLIYSVLFGVTAALAMLIKGNGASLALLPAFVIIFNRKYSLIGRLSFWVPVAIVTVIVGPWYLLTYGQVAAGFRYGFGLDYTLIALVENSRILYSNLGLLVLVLVAIGLAAGACRTPIIVPSGFHGLVGLLAAVWVFQSVAPAAIQDRYLAPLLPPLFLLAGIGGQVMSTTARRCLAMRGAEVGIFAIAVLSLLPTASTVGAKERLGFRDLAKMAWANRTAANPVVLIAARESAEAAAVAELAMADPARPSLFAVRGSRLLGGGGYNRSDYAPKFSNPDSVAAELDADHVPLVLYQADPGGWAHVAQIEAVRAAAAPPWRPLGVAGSPSEPATLYALPLPYDTVANIDHWLQLTGPRALQ